MTDRTPHPADPWSAPVPGPSRHAPPRATARGERGKRMPSQPVAPVSLGPASGSGDAGSARPVRIVAIDMPFWSLVGIMLKFALAAIPALLVLLAVLASLLALLGLLLGSAIVSSLSAFVASAVQSIPWF